MLTGPGTKFVAYLSPSPTLFKHEINIYWPIMKNKLNFDHISKEMLSLNMIDGLR